MQKSFRNFTVISVSDHDSWRVFHPSPRSFPEKGYYLLQQFGWETCLYQACSNPIGQFCLSTSAVAGRVYRSWYSCIDYWRCLLPAFILLSAMKKAFLLCVPEKKRHFKTCVRVEDGQQSLEKYVKWDLMCTWKHVQDIKLWPMWRDGINLRFLSFPHVFASSLHCQFRFLAEPGCCFEFFSIPMWFAFS